VDADVFCATHREPLKVWILGSMYRLESS